MPDEKKLDFFQEIAERNYTEAFEILGGNFIPPVQAAAAWGLKYNYMQLACRGVLVPHREVLEWARDNNCMVVPGPPRKLNLADIRKLNVGTLYGGLPAWYEDPAEQFSRSDKVKPEWLVIRKGWVPDSTNKSWSEQLATLGHFEDVLNVAEAVWAFDTYYKVRGEYPFSDITYVRTSSVYSGGGHVYVGCHWDVAGTVIIGDSDDTRRSFIGLASLYGFDSPYRYELI